MDLTSKGYVLVIVLAVIGIGIGLGKTYVNNQNRLFGQTYTMKDSNTYIVQYVGFQTRLDKETFIQRWTPFASGFKNAGIKTIDLYQVVNGKEIQFISRNIWDERTYFQNFPLGIAGAGGGGGVSVIQFGGFFIPENELPKPLEMHLLFTNEKVGSSSTFRKKCAETIKFMYSVENFMTDQKENAFENNNILSCTHLKTM